jgi:hypothetical protein
MNSDVHRPDPDRPCTGDADPGSTAHVIDPARGEACRLAPHPAIAWFGDELNRQARNVARARGEARGAALLAAARRLGGYIPHGVLGRGDIALALEEAGHECGLPQDEVLATIRAGLVEGAANPLPWPAGLERPGAAPEDAWPPLRLGEPPPLVPAPCAVLPPVLRAYCLAVAETTHTPADFALAALLTVAGAAIGQSVNLRIRRDWAEPPLLYMILVAPPGRRKSAVIRTVRQPLEEMDLRLRRESKAARAAWEKVKKKHEQWETMNPHPGPEPRLRRAVVDDVTPASLAAVLVENPRGVLADPKEATAWVNRFHASTRGRGSGREFWIGIHDGDPIGSDREGGCAPCLVAHPFCSVLAATQPEMLDVLREARGRADGFFERLTLIAPDAASYPSMSWTEAEVAPELDAAWHDCVRLLHAGEMVREESSGIERPRSVPFTEAAKAAWVAWHDAHVAASQAPEFERTLAGAWSKLIGRCARLALILSRLRWATAPAAGRPAAPWEVAEQDVEGAAQLTHWLGTHLVGVAHEMSGGVAGAAARDVLAWLQRHGHNSFREADLINDLRRFRRDPRALAQALCVLESAQIIRRADRPRVPGRPGRPPSPQFLVHPSLMHATGAPV